MADTTFVSRVTNIVTAWAQAVNNWIYRGEDPNFATLTGGPTDYTLTLPATTQITTPSEGMVLRIKINVTNTGPVTLTLLPQGLTAGVQLSSGAALLSGEMLAGEVLELVWTSSVWKIMNPPQVPFASGNPIVRQVAVPTIDMRVNIDALSGDRTLFMIDQDAVVVGRDNPQVLTNKVISKMVGQSTTLPGISGAVFLDTGTFDFFVLTLVGNVTSITFWGPPAAGFTFAVTLILIQGGAGSYTVSWPASILWPSATAPTLTTTVGKSDVITLVTYDGGASWRGFVAGQNY